MKREAIQIYLCSLWCIFWSPLSVQLALWLQIPFGVGIWFIFYTGVAPLLGLLTYKMWQMSKEDDGK